MTDTDDKKISRIAGELSKLGASKGGMARAKRLSPEERSAISRQAAMTRWARKGIEQATPALYGAPDRPLRIAGIEIPCYVLADERRVLAQRGLQTGIGLSRSGGRFGARRMALLLASLKAKGIEINDLIARVNSPIRFIPPHGGNPADGYEATILPDICKVVIEADRLGKLLPQQKHLAVQCRILHDGLAHVGIIALVDEATGFQDARAKFALAEILEKFVAKELRKWLKTFPDDFYKEMFRLKGWRLVDASQARPSVVGHYTNDLVYKRLAPRVLDELRRLTPRDDKGRLKNKLFQWLTEDIGHPKLREHLTAIIMIMKFSPDWGTFMKRMDIALPRWGMTRGIPFKELST